MATFQERFQQVLGPYDSVMRRSVQTVLMFEAQRCIKDKLPSLRPFQRKIAHYNQMVALLETLDFILPHQRKEIFWRTAAAKETIDDEGAWKRSRCVEKELAKIAEKARPFVEAGMCHEDVCEAVIQQQYEGVMRESLIKAGTAGDKANVKLEKKRPKLWEHSHNHNFTAFRLYYSGDKLDPDFPPPRPPVPIEVPVEKHLDKAATLLNFDRWATSVEQPIVRSVSSVLPVEGSAERQRMLAEVRDHLALLKEFEGVVPEEDLNRRKRDLFLALPPAPPPFGAKRLKADDP